jgi:hypothetical protein
MSFGEMSFREKSAWITLVTVLLCFGSYYGALGTGLIGSRDMAAFHFGLLTIIGVFLLQLVLRTVAAMLNPAEARTPRDEREKLIEAKSHTVGYYVMMIGMIAVVVATHLPATHGFMVTVYLGTGVMVIAAASVALAQIIMFRRGA